MARESLDSLQRRHPLLGVAIEKIGEKGPEFVESKCPIPLEWTRAGSGRVGSSALWEDDADSRYLSVGTDWRSGPLVRAAVTSTASDRGENGVHELVLVLHHAIADGTTAVSLLQQWVETAAQHPRDVSSAPPHRRLAATEDLFPDPYRSFRGAGAAEQKRNRDSLDVARHAPVRVPRERHVDFRDRRTRLVHRRLDAAATKALSTACRKRSVTVHGALAACLVEAVHRDAGTPAGTYFMIGSPVSFRTELDSLVRPDEAGTYVATLPTMIKCNPEFDIWAVAGSVNADLAERRARGEHFSMISDLSARVPAGIEESMELLDYMDKEGPINLCLSNIGVQPIPESVGGFTVVDADFAAGISVTGVLVVAATTTHGCLSLNFTYVDGLVSRDRAERIADDSLDILLTHTA
ncbi:hypothetical protein Nans01_34640 [Nocardiopsis ansamitocini]|uniref:Phthiocerol/phthiodiolone dimycocerosyl transferase n=1 Tax=Nocardiopsis ansamitocini TaxID=1670832 RepID=A0A9W6UK24_9ACTN|nr:hypothetical protein Nans01_34640 [Nocardiopsis ansamitocini]